MLLGATVRWLSKAASITVDEESQGRSGVSNAGNAGLLNVKAVYFLMAEYVNTNVEYFVLQSPAYLRDLLDAVVQKHPSFARMMPTMHVVLDGVPAQPSATLKDRDVVDFIPLVAGG